MPETRNLFDQQKRNLRRTAVILTGFVGFLAFLGIGADFFLYGSGAGPGFPVATIGALLFGAGSSLWALRTARNETGSAKRPFPSRALAPLPMKDADDTREDSLSCARVSSPRKPPAAPANRLAKTTSAPDPHC